MLLTHSRVCLVREICLLCPPSDSRRYSDSKNCLARVGEKKRGGRGERERDTTVLWWLSALSSWHRHTHDERRLRLYRCFVISFCLPFRRSRRNRSARELGARVSVSRTVLWMVFLGEKKNLLAVDKAHQRKEKKVAGGNQQTKRDDETNTNAGESG